MVLIFFLIPVTGILPYAATETQASVFNSSSLLVPIYCLFVFTVSGAVMSTPLPYRVASAALKFAGNSTTKLIVGFSVATSVLSMFVSDLAASAIFIGIGLSIVRKIIEDHGGRIWATSRENTGTVMHFVMRKYQEVENNNE